MENTTGNLYGKVAIVTGASRGIGAAIAEELASEGATVVINYMGSEDRANEVKNKIESNKGKAITYKCNVADYDECNQFIKDIQKECGKIDILVNNAGITRDGLVMAMSEEDFDSVIDTNLKGSFNTIRFASRFMMKNRWGRIINLSSVSGLMGNAGQANYSASKAGIIGMTKSIAKELASRNITANAVAPGFIDTDMTQVLPDLVKEQAKAQIPLGRFGKTQDIAQLVAFLASESSSYITRQVIAVDGGLGM